QVNTADGRTSTATRTVVVRRGAGKLRQTSGAGPGSTAYSDAYACGVAGTEGRADCFKEVELDLARASAVGGCFELVPVNDLPSSAASRDLQSAAGRPPAPSPVVPP